MVKSLRLVQRLVDAIKAPELSRYQTPVATIIEYIILGCLMETMSMVIAIVPTTTQVMVGVGSDAVRFGIIVVLLMETALITPPVGMNLYVAQELRSNLRLCDVVQSSMLFMIRGALALLLLTRAPENALFLYGRAIG